LDEAPGGFARHVKVGDPNYPEKRGSSNILKNNDLFDVEFDNLRLSIHMITNHFELPQKTRQFQFIDF
jgi:hypothetical protein